MSEPLRDTKTIRAVKLEALAEITETLLSGGYDGSEGHMGSPDTTFTDFGEVCGIAKWLDERVVALETALHEIAELDGLARRTACDRARAALSVSPAPTLTEPGLAEAKDRNLSQNAPGSVSAVSPAPQERP